MNDPLDIIAELESEDVHKEKKAAPARVDQKKQTSGPQRTGRRRR
jgi:hypothetical protein